MGQSKIVLKKMKLSIFALFGFSYAATFTGSTEKCELRDMSDRYNRSYDKEYFLTKHCAAQGTPVDRCVVDGMTVYNGQRFTNQSRCEIIGCTCSMRYSMMSSTGYDSWGRIVHNGKIEVEGCKFSAATDFECEKRRLGPKRFMERYG